MGDQARRVSTTGAGRGTTALSGVPADATLQPDAKALAGAIGGGGFGASRRSAGAGRQVQPQGAKSGAGSFSGISGLSFRIGPF